MSIQEVLQKITSALDQAGIAYMLSGSFASAYYGAARSTQDIDFVIHASSEQLRSFINALPVSEYYADLDSALEAHQRLWGFIDRSHAYCTTQTAEGLNGVPARISEEVPTA